MRYVIFSPTLRMYVGGYKCLALDYYDLSKPLEFMFEYGDSKTISTYDSREEAEEAIKDIYETYESQLWPNVPKRKVTYMHGCPKDLEVRAKSGKLIDSNPYSYKTTKDGKPINATVRRDNGGITEYYKGKGEGYRVTSLAWTTQYEKAVKFTEDMANHIVTELYFNCSIDAEAVVIYNLVEMNERLNIIKR